MESEHDLTTEQLLDLCNREKTFKSIITTLLESESIELFDGIIEGTSAYLSKTIVPFLNDLREIYSEPIVRFTILSLLKDQLSDAHVRGMSFLLSAHNDQKKRLGILRNKMYASARDTVERYVPAFDSLLRFFSDIDNFVETEHHEFLDLTDEFYEQIRYAMSEDSRITGEMLGKLCFDDSFRELIELEIESYPEVILTLCKMADNLIQAQRYLAEIEIEDLLHDIEENPIEPHVD